MEQFLSEIEEYASAAGIVPQRVLRLTCRYSWDVWETWKSGASSPTMVNADRIRAWMAANPPLVAQAPEAVE